MVNVLKSDFYKLFKRKSFYICGIIAALLAILDVVTLNNIIGSMDLGVDTKSLGFDGIYSIATGLNESTLLITILISMFIPSEFSFGTIKNMASRGISRAEIYFSKVVTSIFVSIVYSVFCAAVGFCAGALMWGVGEFNQEIFLNILRMLGLFILTQIAFQSIFIMIGFIARQTGGTIAINLAVYMLVPTLLIKFIDFISDKWFKYDLSASKYWVGDYLKEFVSLDISQDVINKGIIVSLVYFAVFTLIGLANFYTRDIK